MFCERRLQSNSATGLFGPGLRNPITVGSPLAGVHRKDTLMSATVVEPGMRMIPAPAFFMSNVAWCPS